MALRRLQIHRSSDEAQEVGEAALHGRCHELRADGQAALPVLAHRKLAAAVRAAARPSLLEPVEGVQSIDLQDDPLRRERGGGGAARRGGGGLTMPC